MSNAKESQTYRCKYCLQEINQNATVCYYCSRHQNRCILSLGIIVHVVSISAFITSIITVMIAFSHLKEARQERIAASEALAKAEQAEEKTRVLSNETKKIAATLIRAIYIQLETKNEFGYSYRLKKTTEIIEKDLNQILLLAFPGHAEREAFVQELNMALPKREK